MNTLTHKAFVDGYRSGNISVLINKNKAGDFVLSGLANKHNRPAHLFWTWLGLFLVVPAPIALFFVSWIYAISIFLIGLLVIGAARKTATQFVLRNMLEDEMFFDYVLLHNGATIVRR